MSLEIRFFGDPVLRQVASAIENIDGKVARMASDMFAPMYEAEGIKRLFVYDLNDGEGPQVLVNPTISESAGEWDYPEGCLSIPGFSFDIVRPKEVHLTGYDLDGNDVSIEADELTARLFQHELDHLDGVLLFDHLDKPTRKEAFKLWRANVEGRADDDADQGFHFSR